MFMYILVAIANTTTNSSESYGIPEQAKGWERKRCGCILGQSEDLVTRWGLNVTR